MMTNRDGYADDDRAGEHADRDLVAGLAGGLPGGPDPDLGAARARLLETARREGLIDIAYRVIDSPVGGLLVCVSAAGLVRVAFESEGHDLVLADLAGRLSPRILSDARTTDPVVRELHEYFDGRRHSFDVPVDLGLARGFRQQVLERLREVPFGATTSYAGLAAAAGSPRAVRAVGTACATNPVPIVVPCHRVVRSDGATGNYRGGVVAKRLLLDLERSAG